MAYGKTDVIHRAEHIIQAKRYRRIVSAESVRALAGLLAEHLSLEVRIDLGRAPPKRP